MDPMQYFAEELTPEEYEDVRKQAASHKNSALEKLKKKLPYFAYGRNCRYMQFGVD